MSELHCFLVFFSFVPQNSWNKGKLLLFCRYMHVNGDIRQKIKALLLGLIQMQVLYSFVSNCHLILSILLNFELYLISMTNYYMD